MKWESDDIDFKPPLDQSATLTKAQRVKGYLFWLGVPAVLLFIRWGSEHLW